MNNLYLAEGLCFTNNGRAPHNKSVLFYKQWTTSI